MKIPLFFPSRASIAFLVLIGGALCVLTSTSLGQPGKESPRKGVTVKPVAVNAVEVKAVAPNSPSGSASSPSSATGKETAGGITWLPYEEGVKKAKEKNKQTLIDFSTAWCGYCKKMDRETFTDPRVIKYVTENFVAVRVDGDSRREFSVNGFTTTEKQLTEAQYGVRGYPTFWFLEPNGDKIGQVASFLAPDNFLSLLSHVKDRKYEKKVDVTDSSSADGK